jgi:hypothetical protein
MQELNGYLSTKLPPEFETLSEAIHGDSVKKAGLDFYRKPVDEGTILTYLGDHYQNIGGKSFTEFIGYLYYDHENIIDELGKDDLKLGEEYLNGIFSIVTMALFSKPACKYPGTSSFYCETNIYGYPIESDESQTDSEESSKEIYASPKLQAQDMDTETFFLDGTYLIGNKISTPISVQVGASVSQEVPLPNGNLVLVALSTTMEIDQE